MGKKIARGIGSAICVILFLLCAVMLVFSFVFGAEGIVGIFGYNVFICESSYYESVPQGSAVIVESCEPYELENGNLVLYYQKQEDALLDAEKHPVMGYAGEVSTVDGLYYISVSGEGGEASVAENDLVGRCHWASKPLGSIIDFVQTPLGVCLMAVLPCLAFVIFELTRRYDELQVPEVQPVVKNPSENKPSPRFGVNSEGKATYSRYGRASTQSTDSKRADSVLFSLNSDKSAKRDVFGGSARPAAKPKTSSRTEAEKPAVAAAKPATKVIVPPQEPKPAVKGGTPASVAAKRYIDNAVNEPVADRTSEIAKIEPKKKSDAFFAQSTAPQIGKRNLSTTGGTQRDSRAVIDLEETLASSRKGTSGKRSADILASRSRRDLMSDDSANDAIDRSRYDVDDILAGIGNRRKP